MNKAIFLDRDGVLNKERKDYVKSLEELEIFPQIVQPIKKFNELGYLVIVITNQSAINRGLTTHENVIKIHQHIQEFLISQKAKIDDFYYCPHRPDENCDCRKPKPSLLEKAAEDLKIDLKLSWMIGDRDSDMEAAQQAGCKSIKIDEDGEIKNAVEDILKSK